MRQWTHTEAEVKKTSKSAKREPEKKKKENQAVDQAIENAQMDIPEAMIEFQVRQMADDFARRDSAAGSDRRTVLPVYRNDSREDDGRDETTG